MKEILTELLLENYTILLYKTIIPKAGTRIGVKIGKDGRVVAHTRGNITDSNSVSDILEEAYNRLEADGQPANNPS